MPCTPAKARHLFKSGKARPKRNKLGLFYVQLCYEQEPDNQPLAAGIDPGSKFEGYSVVGSQETVLNQMAEAPEHMKEAVDQKPPPWRHGEPSLEQHQHHSNITRASLHTIRISHEPPLLGEKASNTHRRQLRPTVSSQ